MADFSEYIREMEREHAKTLRKVNKGGKDSPKEKKYVLNPLHPENASVIEDGRGKDGTGESGEDDSECLPI